MDVKTRVFPATGSERALVFEYIPPGHGEDDVWFIEEHPVVGWVMCADEDHADWPANAQAWPVLPANVSLETNQEEGKRLVVYGILYPSGKVHVISDGELLDSIKAFKNACLRMAGATDSVIGDDDAETSDGQ